MNEELEKKANEEPLPILEIPEVDEPDQRAERQDNIKEEVDKIKWDRPLVAEPKAPNQLWQDIKYCLKSLWESRFMLLIFGLMASCILFGIDVFGRNWVYVVLHLYLMVTVVRVLWLQYQQKDDEILKRVTGQKG